MVHSQVVPLCLVTDRSLCSIDLLPEKIAAAVSGGVTMVQVREKDLPGGELFALAKAVKARIAGRALLIVNERTDIAIASGADGVHLAEASMPTVEARRVAGGNLLIGRSVHSVDAARTAEAQGADYLIVGTMYETRSKPGKTPEGLALMREASRAVRIPCLGIGGVTAHNAPEVLKAGAKGIAVVSAILSAYDSQRAARELRLAMAPLKASK